MKTEQLFDTICLWLNTTDLERAVAVARDMRACTRTVLISPNLFLAHGPNALRRLCELGIHNIILDMRVIGSCKEIWQCAFEAGKMDVKALSVSAMAGYKGLAVAKQAADASINETFRLRGPAILASPLPIGIDSNTMSVDLQMRVRRPGHIERLARVAVDAEAAGIIAEYEDVRVIRRVTRTIPLFVYAQRGAVNYAVREPEEVRNKPGVTAVLATKASHVIFDSTFVDRTDVEWAADMLLKELAAIKNAQRSTDGDTRNHISPANLCHN